MKYLYCLVFFLALLPFQIFANNIESQGVISHWPFDEVSGVRFDSATTSNDLADINSTGYTTGLLSNAIDTASTSLTYVEIADASQTNLEPAGDFSISLWLNARRLEYTTQIISKYGGGNGTYGYTLEIYSNGSVKLDLRNGSSLKTSCTTNSGVVTVGSWFHVFATRQGTNVDIYVDGSLESCSSSDTTLSGSPAYNTKPFRVGARADLPPGSSAIFDGYIDEVTFLGYFGSATTASYFYNSGTPLTWLESLSTVASSTDVLIVPYNNSMPQLLSVTCPDATCTLNYATGTFTYMSLSNILLFAVFAFIVMFIVGFITWRLL